MNQRFDLIGRTVIITGGGKGIGKVYVGRIRQGRRPRGRGRYRWCGRQIGGRSPGRAGLAGDRSCHRHCERGVHQGDGVGRARGLRRHRRARQQCLAHERACAPVLARYSGRGVGPGHGGQPARHVPVLPRGVSRHEGARAGQDRQHLLVAGVGGHAQPAALHHLESRRHRLHPRARRARSASSASP